MQEYIKPVSRVGLTAFLCSVFIINPVQNLSPTRLVSELARFPDVGTLVYKRVRSKRPFEKPFLEVTILQLFASDLVQFNITESDSPKALCKLSVGLNMAPCYLDDEKWKSKFLI